MGWSDQTFFVSRFIFAAYVASIFLLSLILALAISLGGVKRSGCDTDTFSVVLKNTEDTVVRNKRNTESDDKFYQHINELKKYDYTHPRFRNIQREIPRCPEIYEYDPNGSVWEKDRLPKNIFPTRYELEFYRPIFPQKIYNGEVGIFVNVTEDVDTFLVHANFLNVIYPFVFDNENKSLELKCADYYPLYEYYIVRTKEKVRQDQGPLQMKLYFNGFLDKYESGLFLVDYKTPASDFNGWV